MGEEKDSITDVGVTARKLGGIKSCKEWDSFGLSQW